MGFLDECANKVRSEFKVIGGFPPLSTIKPGDFGLLEGSTWRRVGHLSDLHDFRVPLTVTASPTIENVEWKSDGTSAVRFDAGANFGDDRGARLNAGFRINFENEFEFFYWLPGLAFHELTQLDQVMNELIRRSKLPSSNPQYFEARSYYVASGVYATRNMTSVLARGAKRGITLEANGIANAVGLDSVNVKFSVTSRESSSQRYMGKIADDVDGYYTPFLELKKIHWNPWSTWYGNP